MENSWSKTNPQSTISHKTLRFWGVHCFADPLTTFKALALWAFYPLRKHAIFQYRPAPKVKTESILSKEAVRSGDLCAASQNAAPPRYRSHRLADAIDAILNPAGVAQHYLTWAPKESAPTAPASQSLYKGVSLYPPKPDWDPQDRARPRSEHAGARSQTQSIQSPAET